VTEESGFIADLFFSKWYSSHSTFEIWYVPQECSRNTNRE